MRSARALSHSPSVAPSPSLPPSPSTGSGSRGSQAEEGSMHIRHTQIFLICSPSPLGLPLVTYRIQATSGGIPLPATYPTHRGWTSHKRAPSPSFPELSPAKLRRLNRQMDRYAPSVRALCVRRACAPLTDSAWLGLGSGLTTNCTMQASQPVLLAEVAGLGLSRVSTM